MEITPSDRLAAQIHFAKARENLRALAALFDPLAPSATSDTVRAAIGTAGEALDVAAHALDESGPDAARVPCPFCANRVVRSDDVRSLLAQAGSLPRKLTNPWTHWPE